MHFNVRNEVYEVDLERSHYFLIFCFIFDLSFKHGDEDKYSK